MSEAGISGVSVAPASEGPRHRQATRWGFALMMPLLIVAMALAVSLVEPRVLSLRSFDKEGMMAEAILTQPGEADAGIRKLFENPEAVTIHAHNATRGCFSAKIERN